MTSPESIVRQQFGEHFAESPTLIVAAPGRVNLIGEHTDYNDGFVLPCAINFRTAVAASRRDDQRVRVIAADYGGEADEFDLSSDIPFVVDRSWPNYIRGVFQVLISEGHSLTGTNLVIAGNVPQGAGLSSSASLEVAVGQTLKQLYSLPLSDNQLAIVGQSAENEFVGCNCGIMDQMISVKGVEGHAMLLDCRSLATRSVSIPAGASIIIVNSNVKRGLVDSAYNERREQCESAAKHFGVRALRDVTYTHLTQNYEQLESVVAKRARHVITENERTEKAAEVLTEGDLKLMGELMAASHVSMRDDFEITVPEIDYLVEVIQNTIGDQGGVRMTGGGFGGCVVALVPESLTDHVLKAVAENYEKHTGIKETTYVCTASAGAIQLSQTR